MPTVAPCFPLLAAFASVHSASEALQTAGEEEKTYDALLGGSEPPIGNQALSLSPSLGLIGTET